MFCIAASLRLPTIIADGSPNPEGPDEGEVTAAGVGVAGGSAVGPDVAACGAGGGAGVEEDTCGVAGGGAVAAAAAAAGFAAGGAFGCENALATTSSISWNLSYLGHHAYYETLFLDLI